MTGSVGLWNAGLLFAALLVVIGVISIVGSDSLSQRWMSCGLFLQGLILILVAGSGYFRGSIDLRITAMAVTCHLMVQSLLAPSLTDDDPLDDVSPR